MEPKMVHSCNVLHLRLRAFLLRIASLVLWTLETIVLSVAEVPNLDQMISYSPITILSG